MVVKHFQIYGVGISRNCKSKQKLKVDLFTTHRQNYLQDPHHHPLGRGELLIPGATKELTLYFFSTYIIFFLIYIIFLLGF